MNKNCLTCRYEPEWSAPVGTGDATRRSGPCKWELSHALPPIPACYMINRLHIIRHSNDSGLPTRCPAWEAK